MGEYSKVDQRVSAGGHDIVMRDRKQLDISGVKHVESFDSDEFQLQTVMGYMEIKGHNLQMKNLDVEKGVLSITGRINMIIYSENGDKTKGFFSKLFR